jgi:hypothetical protein
MVDWKDQVKGDPISWLLEPEDAAVRHLALRDLLGMKRVVPEMAKVRKAAHQEHMISTILDNMNPLGWWAEDRGGYNPKYKSAVWSLIYLSQLGADVNSDARIATACRYYLDHAITKRGQISVNQAPSYTIDCLQGNMLTALLDLGYEDERYDQAFEWMARTVTGEGIAPSGEKKSELRYYASKCGPDFACGANYNKPCAWGGIKVMLALSRLPKGKRTPLIQRAIDRGVDFFFKVEPSTADYPSSTAGAPPSRNWWKFGFPVFYITDLLQLAEALVGLGYSKDPRLAKTLQLIRDKQDENGRWALDYHYAGKTWVDIPAPKQPNKWVTLRALRVLKQAA